MKFQRRTEAILKILETSYFACSLLSVDTWSLTSPHSKFEIDQWRRSQVIVWKLFSDGITSGAHIQVWPAFHDDQSTYQIWSWSIKTFLWYCLETIFRWHHIVSLGLIFKPDLTFMVTDPHIKFDFDRSRHSQVIIWKLLSDSTIWCR